MWWRMRKVVPSKVIIYNFAQNYYNYDTNFLFLQKLGALVFKRGMWKPTKITSAADVLPKKNPPKVVLVMLNPSPWMLKTFNVVILPRLLYIFAQHSSLLHSVFFFFANLLLYVEIENLS